MKGCREGAIRPRRAREAVVVVLVIVAAGGAWVEVEAEAKRLFEELEFEPIIAEGVGDRAHCTADD